MDIDVGQIRFFTKVVEKAPRGLRLLLFKDKFTNKEKLIFLVKTASEDVEKLALSKMTWIVEKSTINPRVILVKLLILPDGQKDFYKSETGLIITESKDIKSLEALSKQISIEIYFFNTEAEFHSKIELLTTPRMLDATKKFYEKAKLLDDSRALSQSENISDLDMKNAIDAKNKAKVKSSDLDESIQKKMPTVSDTSHIRSKSEESNKTSVKSSDVMQSGVSFQNASVEKNNHYISNDDKKQNYGLTLEDLKNAVSVPPGKITADELSKTVPPVDKKQNYGLTLEDLKNAVSVPPGKITSHELYKTIPPIDKKQDYGLTLEDLKNAVSVPPGKITIDELAKTIPPTDVVNKNNTINNEFPFDPSILDGLSFFNTEPEKKKEEISSPPPVIENKKPDSNVNNDHLFKTQDLLSLLQKEGGLSDKIFNKNKNDDDLMAALKHEPTPIPKNEPILKSNNQEVKNVENETPEEEVISVKDAPIKLNFNSKPIVKPPALNINSSSNPLFKPSIINNQEKKELINNNIDDLFSSVKQEPTSIPKNEPVLKSSSFDNNDLMAALKQEFTPIPKNEPVLKSSSFDNNDLMAALKQESTPLPELQKDYLNNTVKLSSLINTGKIPKIEQDSLLNDLMSEPTPLPNIINTLNPTQPKNNKITLNQIEETEKKSISKIISEIDESKEISPEDLVRILGDL